VTGVPITVHDGYDPIRVAASPANEGATLVTLVPTTLGRLLEVDPDAPGRFRRVVVGGAPTPPHLRARAESVGGVVADAYGQTETWGGCVIEGRPNAGVEIRLGDDDEILVRGAPVMRGYRFDEAATAGAFTADGWLRTGDAGAYGSDGRLRVTDRRRDLIVTGGVNVSPTAIENALLSHPAIADVCVAGRPDDEWGERVVAFVVPVDATAAPSVAALRDFARDVLTRAQLPREVVVTAAIPRTPGGKPRRHLLA
jgi:O-succinylbenzoic acid--CoA ligase